MFDSTPFFFNSCEMLLMALEGPEMTQKEEVLIAARDNWGIEEMRGRISFGGRGMASMEPGGICCMSLPLSAVILSASSRENTPERQAAVYSPMLCPIMAKGLIPRFMSSLDRAYSIIKISGWVISVLLISTDIGFLFSSFL